MDYLRQQLSGRGDPSDGSRSGSGNTNGPFGRPVTIHPGQVEEAVHIIDYQGAINLSRLRFSVTEEEQDGDSFLDVAVFQVPAPHCNSQLCDLSEYGVGKLEHFNGASYLSLCNNDGRLQIDRERFRGHHTELLVPGEGPMIQDHILDGGEILVTERDRTYEVIIANCNKQGRQVKMAGQVIFQSFGRQYGVDDPAVGLHLLMIGVAICLFFSICNLRISMGTRAEYSGTRLLPLFRDGSIAHEQYRVVRRQEVTINDTNDDTEDEEGNNGDVDVDVDGDSSEEDQQGFSSQSDPSRQLELVQVL